MDSYTQAATERAMKVQEVMLQAMAKKITWWQAAEILGISDRHMRRWRERYVEEGYNGLLDRRRGKPSRRRVPVATVEKVFALYREKYFDLNVQHFHEKFIHDGTTHTLDNPALPLLVQTFEMVFQQYHRHPESKSFGPEMERPATPTARDCSSDIPSPLTVFI